MLNIKVYWVNPSPWNECKFTYKVTFGFGYNSNDVNVEAYFQEGSSLFSGDSFSANNLAPGVYYYKAKNVFNSLQCGTGQGDPLVVLKRAHLL